MPSCQRAGGPRRVTQVTPSTTPAREHALDRVDADDGWPRRGPALAEQQPGPAADDVQEAWGMVLGWAAVTTSDQGLGRR